MLWVMDEIDYSDRDVLVPRLSPPPHPLALLPGNPQTSLRVGEHLPVHRSTSYLNTGSIRPIISNWELK